MIKNGLIDEVKQLLQKYKNFPTAMQGIGYKEIKEYLDGSISIEEAIEKIKKESRNYAKRQITWFKKNQETIWLNGEIERKQNVKIIQENL